MVSDGVVKHHHHHPGEMSFRIRQDSGFFSRLMAKETSSIGNSSSRVYYGETSVAVPFMWEEQPGTPKHPLSKTSLPPLTPPPSYYSTNKSNSKRRNSKAKVFSSILPRFVIGSRKSHVSPSSSSSCSPSNSSSSSWSLVAFSSYEKKQGEGNPSFSHSRSHPLKHKSSNGFTGCYPFGNMKNNVSHGEL